MTSLFIKEQAIWFVFFCVSLGMMNGLLFLDSGFYQVSVLYFNTVYSVLFFIFISWRYVRDRVNLQKIQQQELADVQQLSSPYLTLLVHQFQQELLMQTEEVSQMKIQLLESRDDTLAWVHEVKTPLTAMQLMIEQVENPKQKMRLEYEWLRLYMLVDQQLHQTRLQTIAEDNRLEQVELRNVIFNEIRALKSWCLEKGIGFEVEDLDQQVITDAKWLAFIVRQILSNAVKYSHPGSEVHIFTSQQEGKLSLHIEDTGIGIAPEDVPRIFRKSYTGTVGRESTAATGMGLYLAQNAANKLGLMLAVHSKLGEGTTLTITFSKQNEYMKSYGM